MVVEAWAVRCIVVEMGRARTKGGKWLQSVQHPAQQDEPALHELEICWNREGA
jgi:hypothetical protein